jgi:hypothetical protein
LHGETKFFEVGEERRSVFGDCFIYQLGDFSSEKGGKGGGTDCISQLVQERKPLFEFF